MLRRAAACCGMLQNPHEQAPESGAAACCGMLQLLVPARHKNSTETYSKQTGTMVATACGTCVVQPATWNNKVAHAGSSGPASYECTESAPNPPRAPCAHEPVMFCRQTRTVFSSQKVPQNHGLVLVHGHEQPRTVGKTHAHCVCTQSALYQTEHQDPKRWLEQECHQVAGRRQPHQQCA